MKNKKYSILTLTTAAIMLMMSSCLKDSRYVDFSKVGTLVELPLAAFTGAGNLAPEALPIQSTPQTFPVVINVAAPKALSTALSVTLKLNTDSLAKFNQGLLNTFNTDSTAYANDTTGTVAAPAPLIQYALPPTGSYSIPSLTATVPANQHETTISITVNTSLLNPSSAYVIPITLVSASGQKISNYNTVFYNIQAKNAYDGVYALTGYVHRDADLTLGGPIKSGVTSPLATTGASSLSFSQDWANGSETGGVNPITFVVNPSTNAVTISSIANPTLGNLPGYNSHYDPAKKTFYVGIIWNGTDPTHRSAIDTLTYSGSR